MTNDSATTADLSAASCVACGYSLRGLSVGDLCPECGKLVEASVIGDLANASDTWLKGVARGAQFTLLIPPVLILAGAIIAYALHVAAVVDGEDLFVIALLFFVVMMTAWSFGWLLMLRPDKWSTNPDDRPASARFAVALFIITFIGQTVALVVGALSAALTLRHNVSPSAWLAGAALILLVMAIEQLLILIPAYICTLHAAAWLLRRAPDAPAAKRAVRFIWMAPLVLIIAAVPVMLVGQLAPTLPVWATLIAIAVTAIAPLWVMWAYCVVLWKTRHHVLRARQS